MNTQLSTSVVQPDLFSPVQIGSYTLKNRIVMAPLTRMRADENNIPTNMSRIYYQQRATAGLIITEGTQISPQGAGYPNTPGIYNHDQVKAWRQITDSVHAQGGRIFLQLWHVGRVSYPGIQLNDEPPVAPSAIKAEGDYVKPRALEPAEIDDIIYDYWRASENAFAAGFDGVEVHAANGYLIDQFLRDSTNKRTDQYGGSYKNRARFLFEVLHAVISVWGSERVGLRLSPTNPFNSISDSNPEELFEYIVERLNPLDLAYLHIVEGGLLSPDTTEKEPLFDPRTLRNIYDGPYMANNGYSKGSAKKAIKNDSADLVSFGDLFISNPDLPERFLRNAPLNKTDLDSRYGGNEKGYIDYPSLNLALA
ncbi:MAG: alkene reductase [Piscirickettsiaceae bacterium]|nr:alkene reductase [Piscirickettsiaceae bacterium]